MCLECGLGWFRCGLGWFGGGLGLPWQVNVIKNALKFLLQLLKLSQKHILDVNTVVLGWFRGGFGLFGGGLGWFGVFWGGLGCFHGPAATTILLVFAILSCSE